MGQRKQEEPDMKPLFRRRFKAILKKKEEGKDNFKVFLTYGEAFLGEPEEGQEITKEISSTIDLALRPLGGVNVCSVEGFGRNGYGEAVL